MLIEWFRLSQTDQDLEMHAGCHDSGSATCPQEHEPDDNLDIIV